MATVGLDKLFYSRITEGPDESEVYGKPKQLAKAISAELSVELAEAVLYADDGAAEVIKEFRSGKLGLGVDDIGRAAAEELTGATTDDNGVLVSRGEDVSMPVAIGFRAKKGNGRYRYFWLYRVKFGIPATNLQTKGDSISFQTPTIEGTVMRRNKPDSDGKHPWKAEVTEGEAGVSAQTISEWYTTVYEPSFAETPEVEPESRRRVKKDKNPGVPSQPSVIPQTDMPPVMPQIGIGARTPQVTPPTVKVGE